MEQSSRKSGENSVRGEQQVQRAELRGRWFYPSNWPIFGRMVAGIVGLLSLAILVAAGAGLLISRQGMRTKSGETFQYLARDQVSSIGDYLSMNITILRNVALIAQVRARAAEARDRYTGSPQEIESQLRVMDEQWATAADDSQLVRSVIDPQANPIAAQLIACMKEFPDHVEIFVTDRYGGLVAATNRVSDYYQADEEWWQSAYSVGQGALYIGQPKLDESSGYLALQMAAPVVLESGEVVGIVRSTLRIDDMQGAVNAFRLGQTGHAVIVDSKGAVVAGPDLTQTGKKLPASWISTEILMAKEGWTRLVDEQGKGVLVGYASFVNIDLKHKEETDVVRRLGWTAFVYQSATETFSVFTQTMVITGLITLGFIFLSAVLAFLLARSIARPIVELAAVARQMTEGDLRIRVPFRRFDEIGQLANAFENMASRVMETVSTLERRVAERTRNLESAARVSSAVTAVLEPGELERRVVDLVQQSFGLYYVGLFLVDQTGEWTGQPNHWIVLRAGTGEPGQLMVERGHKFEMGDPNSMIGRCISEGRAIIALDVGREPHRFENPLLPNTHSEMALPLIARGRVLGAMTIQSDKVAAFSDTEITTMQTMADQVAGAVDNARSFSAAQEALARSEEVIRRYVRESWGQFVEAEEVSGYLYTPQAAGFDNMAWLPEMGEAVRRKEMFQAVGGGVPEDGAALALPLLYGNQVIGTIGLRRSAPGGWTEEEVSLVRDVSLQVAQAVENRRLFEQTRRSAQREAVLRQTSDRVRSQASLDALLRSAVQEIQRAVGASHVAIRLGTEEKLVPASKRPASYGGKQDAG